jgi:hypothetical protein
MPGVYRIMQNDSGQAVRAAESRRRDHESLACTLVHNRAPLPVSAVDRLPCAIPFHPRANVPDEDFSIKSQWFEVVSETPDPDLLEKWPTISAAPAATRQPGDHVFSPASKTHLNPPASTKEGRSVVSSRRLIRLWVRLWRSDRRRSGLRVDYSNFIE